MSLCTAAHPIYTRSTDIFGASNSKATIDRTLGEHAEQTFDVEQGLVYSIASRPGAGLLRTALAIEAPHSNQLLADRVDESKHG